MGRKMKIDYKIVAVLMILVVMAMFFMYGGEYIGLGSDSAEKFINSIPGLLVVGIGAYSIPKRGIFTTAGFCGLGIGFALLVGAMYDSSLVSDQMLTGLTLLEEQMLIVISFTAIGMVSLAIDK